MSSAATNAEWADPEAKQALQHWEDYQRCHDVSALQGKAVGIDPKSGSVWFGEDAIEVSEKARAEGVGGRIICIRVGLGYYQRKGGRR